MSNSKILFLLTGSIACYKACQVLSRVVQAGHEVQVVASPAALQFVGNATFEGLTGKSVISDLYAPGNVMEHIHLMRWADLIVVAPATANYINKIARGVGDDLLTTLFLAHDFKKPFLVAPAMNSSMFEHPITQESLQKLKDIGISVLDSASGILACGEVGAGKLLDPDSIFTQIQKSLPFTEARSPKSSPAPQKIADGFLVLITAGGTVEPIDDVRTLTNTSLGTTGIKLAEFLTDFGANVHLLRAASTPSADARIKQSTFSTFESLQSSVRDLIRVHKFDLIIHAAAVSDFSVESIEINGKKYSPSTVAKIESSDKLAIYFKNNPKIVDEIKELSANKNAKLIAFKLTSNATPDERDAAVQKLLSHSHADYIVHNDKTDIDKIKQIHRFTLYGKNQKTPLDNIESLASKIAQIYLKESL